MSHRTSARLGGNNARMAAEMVESTQRAHARSRTTRTHALWESHVAVLRLRSKRRTTQWASEAAHITAANLNLGPAGDRNRKARIPAHTSTIAEATIHKHPDMCGMSIKGAKPAARGSFNRTSALTWALRARRLTTLHLSGSRREDANLARGRRCYARTPLCTAFRRSRRSARGPRPIPQALGLEHRLTRASRSQTHRASSASQPSAAPNSTRISGRQHLRPAAFLNERRGVRAYSSLRLSGRVLQASTSPPSAELWPTADVCPREPGQIWRSSATSSRTRPKIGRRRPSPTKLFRSANLAQFESNFAVRAHSGIFLEFRRNSGGFRPNKMN